MSTRGPSRAMHGFTRGLTGSSHTRLALDGAAWLGWSKLGGAISEAMTAGASRQRWRRCVDGVACWSTRLSATPSRISGYRRHRRRAGSAVCAEGGVVTSSKVATGTQPRRRPGSMRTIRRCRTCDGDESATLSQRRSSRGAAIACGAVKCGLVSASAPRQLPPQFREVLLAIARGVTT